MKNLLTVLKKLGKKMTSQDINGTNLVTVVDDIANKYTGGGGSGGSGSCDCTMIVTENEETLDKTWQEIYDAIAAGKRVVLVQTSDSVTTKAAQVFLDQASIFVDMYIVSGGNTVFRATTATGYPVLVDDEAS